MKSQETKVPVGGFTGRYCNARGDGSVSQSVVDTAIHKPDVAHLLSILRDETVANAVSAIASTTQR